MRRVRIARQKVQHLFPILHAPTMNLVAQHGFRALIMQTFIEEKFRIAPRLPNRPSGKSFRNVDYVLLRVSAIDSEGVKFHEFAAVVFIQTAILVLLPFRLGAVVLLLAPPSPLLLLLLQHGPSLWIDR